MSKEEWSAEWLEAIDVTEMLWSIEPYVADGVVTERKLRLFACARARRVWHLLTPVTRQRTVELAERVADSEVSQRELHMRWRETEPKGVTGDGRLEPVIARCCLLTGSLSGDGNPYYFLKDLLRDDQQPAAEHNDGTAPDLLRCIVGNPFRPVTFASCWRTETTVALAAGIYADRAFDRLPILADALEEAGCDNADVLSHCRGLGPHARGCWVVDLVLNKS